MGFRLELPDIGEGVVEAEVQKWFVGPGDVVGEDQPLVEVMTDKATVTIPSPRRGRIVKLFWKEGEIAKVHSPLVEMEEEAGAAAVAPEATSPRAAGFTMPRAAATAVGPQRAPDGKALATPAVRAMARELGVDVNAVPGTGPGGRVTKADLDAFRLRKNGQALAARGGPGAVPLPGAGTTGLPVTLPSAAAGAPGAAPAQAGDERVPLRGVRKRIAENMARSKRTAAHFTFVEQADVSELVRLKDRIAAAARGEGVKLTFLPFVVKAVVAALRRHPRLNATMDDERGELVLHRRFDIGLASATDAGLVVPVIRDADRRSMLDLAREIDRLASASKAGGARPEDMGRSTFTITSLGALGGLFATPVLNYPEVAILGVHRIRPTPIVRDGQIVVRDVMYLSVTSDHRLVDGDEAARFAYEVIRYLEDPGLLFMQMV
jgi:pyruvate dehydrogenase E2 component (dihydrolipoamide acetyltransferase)